MSHIKMAMVCILVLLSASCRTVKFNVPSDIKGETYAARDAAKASIESHGAHLKAQWDCTVVKHKGQKKFGPMWTWYDPGYKQYVGGLCWGKKIEIGCHPVTGSEIFFDAMKHEFGHYWLMSNYNDWNHNSKYAHDFYNWVEASATVFFTADTTKDQKREMIAKIAQTAKEGEWIGVNGVDTNGVRYHIDFVVHK